MAEPAEDKLDEASPQPSTAGEDDTATTTTTPVDLQSETRSSRVFEIQIVKDVNGIGCVLEGGRIPDLIERPIVIKRIFRGKFDYPSN